jgi:hypothetical protein
MGQSPFVKRPGSPGLELGRRRSTRVEAAIRIILTGRDASGQPFREETETTTVNLQGARLKTRYQVLDGIQVGIENPRTGAAEKAICVRVEEPAPGQTAHYIAVQLLNPGNVWGIENPPADWEIVATALGGRAAPSPRPATKLEVLPRPASTAAAAPAVLALPPATPDAAVLFAELEKRSAELMESVVQILRKQTDEIIAKALWGFQQRLEEATTAGETRFGERVDQAFAELESALKTFRADLEDELTARQEQAVESAEQALRARISGLVSTIPGSGTGAFPGKPSGASSKK